MYSSLTCWLISSYCSGFITVDTHIRLAVRSCSVMDNIDNCSHCTAISQSRSVGNSTKSKLLIECALLCSYDIFSRRAGLYTFVPMMDTEYRPGVDPFNLIYVEFDLYKRNQPSLLVIFAHIGRIGNERFWRDQFVGYIILDHHVTLQKSHSWIFRDIRGLRDSKEGFLMIRWFPYRYCRLFIYLYCYRYWKGKTPDHQKRKRRTSAVFMQHTG